MEKSTSQAFFSAFLQCARDSSKKHFPFSKFVALSGFLCVDIDGCMQERFVISEVINNKGKCEGKSFRLQTLEWNSINKSLKLSEPEPVVCDSEPIKPNDTLQDISEKTTYLRKKEIKRKYNRAHKKFPRSTCASLQKLRQTCSSVEGAVIKGSHNYIRHSTFVIDKKEESPCRHEAVNVSQTISSSTVNIPHNLLKNSSMHLRKNANYGRSHTSALPWKLRQPQEVNGHALSDRERMKHIPKRIISVQAAHRNVKRNSGAGKGRQDKSESKDVGVHTHPERGINKVVHVIHASQHNVVKGPDTLSPSSFSGSECSIGSTKPRYLVEHTGDTAPGSNCDHAPAPREQTIVNHIVLPYRMKKQDANLKSNEERAPGGTNNLPAEATLGSVNERFCPSTTASGDAEDMSSSMSSVVRGHLDGALPWPYKRRKKKQEKRHRHDDDRLLLRTDSLSKKKARVFRWIRLFKKDHTCAASTEDTPSHSPSPTCKEVFINQK